LCYCAISPLVFAPLLGPVRYDAERDFAPVIGVVHTPVLLLAHPGFAPNSLAEVVALARSAPGQVRWASSGQATVGHMVLEQVRLASGADITHVPYKGGGQQLNDALGGQFELLSSNAAEQQLQYVRQGRLKALAVGAPARLAAWPGVPTFAEAGYPQANLMSTFGVFAPRATPAAVVARLNLALQAWLQQPERRERLASVGNLVAGGSPQAFGQQIAQARQASARLLGRLASPAIPAPPPTPAPATSLP
jgi:tripartite-type tricarboxylate transporter receptor subunit TctC